MPFLGIDERLGVDLSGRRVRGDESAGNSRPAEKILLISL